MVPAICVHPFFDLYKTFVVAPTFLNAYEAMALIDNLMEFKLGIYFGLFGTSPNTWKSLVFYLLVAMNLER